MTSGTIEEFLKEAPEHIDELIGKWLAGETTTEEQVLLNSWTGEHPDHQKYFDQFRRIFEGTIPPQESFDAEAAWLKVSSVISDGSAKGKVVEMPPRNNKTVLWRVAAAVVFLIAGTYLVFQLVPGKMQSGSIAAATSIVRDTLPDGSTAVVNKGSSLEFKFDSRKKTRTVKLHGEAFFEVVHNEEETFVVETQDVFIQDIGTAFNVKTSDDSVFVEVQVKEGEVRFFDASGTGVNLVAGETGRYSRADHSFIKLQPDDENMSAWVDKDFRFRNSPLKKVVKRLNEVYDIPIELSSEMLGDCRITVNFKQDDIHTIAGVIAETLGLEILNAKNKIVLSGNCQ